MAWLRSLIVTLKFLVSAEEKWKIQVLNIFVLFRIIILQFDLYLNFIDFNLDEVT